MSSGNVSGVGGGNVYGAKEPISLIEVDFISNIQNSKNIYKTHDNKICDSDLYCKGVDIVRTNYH